MSVRVSKFYRCKCDAAGLLLDRFGAPVLAAMNAGGFAGVRFTVSVAVCQGSVAPATWAANVRGSDVQCGGYNDFATPLVLSGAGLKVDQDGVAVGFIAIETTTGQANVLVDISIAISDKERV